MGYCDRYQNLIDQELIRLSENERLFICGELQTRQTIEPTFRLYSVPVDIKNFEFYEVELKKSRFHIEIFPDFPWEPQEYELEALKGSNNLLEPVRVIYTKKMRLKNP